MEDTNYIAPGAQVIGNVSLGENTSVWHNAVIRADHRKIVIGANSNVQDNATLHIEVENDLSIGDYVTVGHNAVVHGCVVGDNTMIGMGAIVMTGAVIGKNCIIGAGAVVTEKKVIPDNSLVMGIPGKIVGDVSVQQAEYNTVNAKHYVDLAKEYQKIDKT